MLFPKFSLLGEREGAPFYRWLHGLRRSLGDSLADAVPEPQASMGLALLLGMRDTLPEEMVEEFWKTGTSHLLAISGLHVGILLGLSLAVSWRVFGRRRQYYLVAPLLLMWLYALMAGMSPSVARAAIMGSVYLAALALGRPRSVMPALGLAAAVMVALDPRVLGNVSFQLSFIAMAGIAGMAEPLSDRIRAFLGDRPEQGLPARTLRAFAADAVAMTIAATIATLPLLAFYFQRISLVGLPTTFLTLPALPLALISHAAAATVGMASSTLAQPLGWLAWVSTSYITGVVGLFARIPAASLETSPVAPLLVAIYYIPFVTWYAAGPLRSVGARTLVGLQEIAPSLPLRQGPVPWWVLLPAISVAALVWIAALSAPDGRLHVTFADVGQGDAALITTPGGATILVDGGPGPLEAARLVGSTLPFWDRSVDVVVLTHAHSDHVNGLIEVLRRYQVRHVLDRKVEYESPAYESWLQAVEREGASVVKARAGQVIALGDGALLEVLWPPEKLMRGTKSDIDNASVVLRLAYGDVSFLLAGDIFREAEKALITRLAPIESDVLKVAHHGSDSSSIAEFLEAVSPEAAVISAGEDNLFGHPHPQTITALLGHVPEDRVFVTGQRGQIEFVTDGRRLNVRTER